MTPRKRPDWEDIWMRTAVLVGKRSLCVRARVGAVIVTRDGRVEAASYNGPSPEFDHRGRPCTSWCARSAKSDSSQLSREYDDCVSSHAEANALIRSDWTNLTDATIYASSAMCMNCAKLVAQTRIRRVVHVVNLGEEHRHPDEVERYLRDMGVVVTRWSG